MTPALEQIKARLQLAIEHGDAHGWAVARNELLGVLGSDYFNALRDEAREAWRTVHVLTSVMRLRPLTDAEQDELHWAHIAIRENRPAPAAEAAPQGGVKLNDPDLQRQMENGAARFHRVVAALNAVPPSAPAEHEGDPQSCREADGCPTEGAVLRREWRAMKARIAALEAALAAGALPQGMVLVPRALAEMAVTVASEWLDLFADTPGLEKYDRFTYGPQVELLRDDLTAALDAAIRAMRQGGGWLPIESAPKDGKPVLVSCDRVVGEAVLHENGEWWWANNHPTDAWGMQIYPDHWQPLPPPPSPAKEG